MVFAVDGAKPGQPIWLILGGGPCAVGPTVYPLCGPLLIGLDIGRPLVAGPFWPVGDGTDGCTGRVRVPLSVPMSHLCVTELSSQFIQLCLGPYGLGTAAINCVTSRLGGT